MSLLRNPSFREGFHAGIPFAIASFILSTTFGVLAHPVMGAIAPIVMSTIVYAGSAQFGALAVLAAGGGPIAAVLAGTLLNMRYLPMGIALAGVAMLVASSAAQAFQRFTEDFTTTTYRDAARTTAGFRPLPVVFSRSAR